MTKYVLGFAFNANMTSLALIEKQKPEWQKGLLNGIGGKIEEDESEYEAMQREFKEEAGIDEENWFQFLIMQGEDWIVHCFWTKLGDEFYKLRSMEAEKVVVVNPAKIHNSKVVESLLWIVPMAVNAATTGIDYSFTSFDLEA